MNHKNITLLQIDYFIAVAKYLNFSEAARRVYTSQPSLSRQILQMEKELGVELFFRTKRNVRLTPAGTVLLNELKGISEQIENAFEKCIGPNLGENSSLSIGCLEAMDTARFLTHLIKHFKEDHPNVEIILERHSFKILREKLDKEQLDIIFTLSFEVDNDPSIVWDTVYKQHTCLLMAANHPLAQRENPSLVDFKEETFVLLSRDESPNGYDGIIAQCRKHGFSPKVVKQLPNIESLLLSVESGLGVAMVDENIRMHHPENFKMCELKDDSLSVVMAWQKSNLKPAVSLFGNAILSDIYEQAFNKNNLTT